MYFTLKDADSRLKSIMFASYNQRLGFIPKEGTKVLACGNISVYERDGAYQFYVTQMQPDGIGSLYLAYEQLKKKLEAEGLFAPERKKSRSRLFRARSGSSRRRPVLRCATLSLRCSGVIRPCRCCSIPCLCKGSRRLLRS